MKKIFFIFIVAFLAVTSCKQVRYEYQTFENDPTNTKIYTLKNGLKVYMSVDESQPRIQTLIGVNVGAKNDPKETTGLAHYFEHLMFKGTENYGTLDFEQEKPLLDSIESKFEIYRTLTSQKSRDSLYHIIDSISYKASEYSIPNEYGKLMNLIGAKGTNAWTSYDQTVFTEDIPSNQIENWAKIQSDRFHKPVIRLFHTELETVYEEKNMSLTSDFRRVIESICQKLYPSHPYGTQTVLGTKEQLKNPSIVNIKNFFKQWYVPNNIAIALSGDFDPDSAVEVIERYFGDLVPNTNLPKLLFEPEKDIEKPIEMDIVGQEAEFVTIGFRFPGAGSKDYLMLEVIDLLLCNERAGIIDINLVQQQKMVSAESFVYDMSDYSTFILSGLPRENQTLEEARDLLLQQLDRVKSGDFDSTLLRSVVNNYKLNQMQTFESYSSVASAHINSFTNGICWGDQVSRVEKMAKITKADVVEFANKHFKENYVVVYKRQGIQDEGDIISKPKITPIATNRDTSSLFLEEIKNSSVRPIEAKFVDFTSQMKCDSIAGGLKVLYKENVNNNLFSINFIVDFGQNHNKLAQLSASLFDYLSTPKYTAEQIKQKFYSLACSFNLSVGADKSYISLSGLDENMDEALELMVYILHNIEPAPSALEFLKQDMFKVRDINKSNQRACFSALQRYVMYGDDYIKQNSVSNNLISSATSAELISIIKSLKNYTTQVLYYGPRGYDDFVNSVGNRYKLAEKLTTMPKEENKMVVTNTDTVFIAPYDAAQIYFMGYSSRGDKFDAQREAINALYNSYFGGGMNSVVFQELREARALAYTATCSLSAPQKVGFPYFISSFIATQNDKMGDALLAFNDILVDMPLSEESFNIVKTTLLNRLRTNRTIKEGVLWSYVSARNRGLDYDINQKIYSAVQNLTLEDIAQYQKQYVKDNKWHYAILGNEKLIDVNTLKEYGAVKRLSLEYIFGY